MSNDVPGDRLGRLFVISAPSGAGKTTLVRKLIKLQPDLRFSVSYTTRKKRPGEIHGVDYFFIDTDRFDAMRVAGDFLEHARVFGNYYGTSRSQVADILIKAHDVILEIDWQGAEQVRKNMPECISVFVLPPSLTVLENRLRGRGTDSEDVIQRRLGEAADDMSHWRDFEHVVINDDVESSAKQLAEIINHPTAYNNVERAAIKSRVDSIIRGQIHRK
jgi:guanylate kinase